MARVSKDFYLAVVRFRIREARNASGLKQEDVADLVDMAPRHYRRLEALSNVKTNPTLGLLREVAHALGTDVPALTAEPTPEEVKRVQSSLIKTQ